MDLADDFAWGLPGASTTPAIPEADAFCTTPLIDHLLASAARDPDAIALVGLTASVRYGELLRCVRNVACAVAERVRPGGAVACLLPKQPDGVCILLGCLISGRPCLVIDAFDPVERLNSLLDDAKPALLLTAGTTPFPFPVLTFDAALHGPDRSWRPDYVWDPDAPLAVHFTSGSTGRPKGIVLSARSVLYRALHTVRTFGMTSDTRMLQPNLPIASTAVASLLGVLSAGGRMSVLDIAREGAGPLLGLMEREAVNQASLTTATLRMLSQLRRAGPAFRTLRVLRAGAGVLPSNDLASWRAILPPDCAIVHAYASTEALTVSSWEVPTGDAREETNIAAGKLHLCHEYALVDEEGQIVPPGAAGELVVRGPYVALGEWRNGGLVPGRMTPVANHPGWRMFRTGDVVRIQPDGMLRVLGRIDRQVKVNGVLVQPAEIEAVLKADPRVTEAAVVARTTPSGSVLHGFVTADGIDPQTLIAALRRRLAERLPMVFRPSRLIVLDRLPMLPGGKVDLVALGRMTAE